jgi:predicted nucleotide-binding protein (sugar kinase/HSP70/actin superfamily)
MYENYPFWFTILTRLGFRVQLSGRSDHALFEAGMDSIPSENVCYPAKLAHGHVEDLVARGVRTIFYPCIAYEQQLVAAADNHYNCPVVMSYPEVIGNNVETLRDHDVRLIRPFLSLADRELLVDRLCGVFADWGIDRAEMAAAVAAGYAEDAQVREDIRAMGRDALEVMERTGTRGIVLAGRPYHCDPEVHHGIPELINSLGLAVLTEDSVVGLGGGSTVDGEPVALAPRPLRVRDQWAYHSRLYEAAARVGDEPRRPARLVQLNSVRVRRWTRSPADQVAGAPRGAAGRCYTVLKIDEVSSLGAARIRLRSLQAAVARAGEPHLGACGRGSGGSTAPGSAATAERKASEAGHVVHQGSLHAREARGRLGDPRPRRWRRSSGACSRPVLRRAAATTCGCSSTPDPRTRWRLGLKHVNNDACYPRDRGDRAAARRAASRAESDPDRTTAPSPSAQTGGMCRATNYAALLRKGLAGGGVRAGAGAGGSRRTGLEDTPGFSRGACRPCTASIQAMVLGDMLQTALILRVRPYEAVPGAADRAVPERWNDVVRE